MLRYRLTPDAVISWGDPPPTWLIQSCRQGYMTTGIISCSPPGQAAMPLLFHNQTWRCSYDQC